MRRCWIVVGSVMPLFAGLFAWGYWSAQLTAPAPTALLLDRHGAFLAQLAAPEGEAQIRAAVHGVGVEIGQGRGGSGEE